MLSMNLGSDESGSHVVLALHGELDLVDAQAVADALGAVAARGARIIVDLSGLEFIDASGVAALSRGRRRARCAGGDLLLAAPQQRVQRVLAIHWEASGSDLPVAVAKAAASAARLPACGRAVPASAAKMRWRHIAMNACSGAASGDKWPALRRLAAPSRRPPTAGGIRGKPPAVVTRGRGW
jgi:anti-sigma B factor antagonist